MANTNQYMLGFTYIVFKGYKDSPILVKPEEIKYIKPACPTGFTLVLKDKSTLTVYDTIEEIQSKLSEMSYKFIGNTTQNETNPKQKTSRRKAKSSQ